MKSTTIQYLPQAEMQHAQTQQQSKQPLQSSPCYTLIPSSINQGIAFQNHIHKPKHAINLAPAPTHNQQNTPLLTPSDILPSNTEDDYGPIEWFLKCLTRGYLNFSARACRREFWGFVFIALLVIFFTTTTDAIFGISAVTYSVNAALLIPLLAVGARRLHDIGLSGWWQLLYLTGFGILLLALMWLLSSDNKTNQYGEMTKNHA